MLRSQWKDTIIDGKIDATQVAVGRGNRDWFVTNSGYNQHYVCKLCIFVFYCVPQRQDYF